MSQGDKGFGSYWSPLLSATVDRVKKEVHAKNNVKNIVLSFVKESAILKLNILKQCLCRRQLRNSFPNSFPN